jgi:predicted RNA-binding Zn ribbon-like protein
MHFNHDGRDAADLGADLANDLPDTAAELQRRCEDAGLFFARRVTRADLDAVQRFLREWGAVADAVDPLERADLLNVLLGRHAGAPRLTDHAGDGWHLHFRADDVTAAHQIATLVSVGTALHLTGRGMTRLGRCAEASCDRIYVDSSKNGRQRYCSPTCGNRAAVRRHRARTAA